MTHLLHPKDNRIDYGEQLIPPDGYKLDRAVGTTYSLDLEALIILPVALFYSQTLDGNPEQLRYDMLDAITEAAEKITVYCQKGQIKVPQKYHHLMAYWEKGIEEVAMPDHLSSFHPKVWVIRYKAKEKKDYCYRLLVTSRNLTFARDWDVAFSTDGKVGDIEQPKNKPLIHFLQFLNRTGTQKIPAYFINDLKTVKFDLPDSFEGLKLMPIGIPDPEENKQYLNPLTTHRTLWDELLIVSPFLDKTTLDTLYNATNKRPYLLSRKEEMDGIEKEILNNFNCWQFSTFIQKAENLQEISEEQPSEQNLHAKLFVAMRDKKNYWYLGSANCSAPAQGRNVEFIVELRGGTKPKEIFHLLTDKGKSGGVTLFEPYDLKCRTYTEEKKRLDLNIRKIKYDISILSIKGTAERIAGGTAYNLLIEIDANNLVLPKEYQVRIKPLSEQLKASVVLIAGTVNTIKDFTGYPETALSPFLVFEIFYKDGDISKSFLLPMEIELPESRLNRIFTSIINSSEKFLKYITFLLTGEETDIIGDLSPNNQKNAVSTGDNTWAFAGIPVFEKLLIAASRYPAKLESVDKVIQKLKTESAQLGEPIIPEDFETFWQVFQTYINNKN